MVGRRPKTQRLSEKRRKLNLARSKNKRGKLQTWNEGSMSTAINEYFAQRDNPHGLSINALSRAYNIPVATLHNRITSGATLDEVVVKPKLGRKTMFSVEQEQELAGFLILSARQGFGLTRMDVRRLAYQYAVRNNIKGFSEATGVAGYDWLQGFIERHPGLGARKPENLSIRRAMCFNKVTVKKHFEGLHSIMTEHNFYERPQAIWNCDESGLQDVFESDDVLAATSGRVFSIAARERGETMTLLSVASAAGASGPNLLIFKGARLRPEWQDQVPSNDMVRVSDSGWIKDHLILEYGKRFVRFLKGSDDDYKKGAKVLLILDGHATHCYNFDFLEYMRDNNVVLWCLPPHTSHHLQPLDKNVFNSLKVGWNRKGREKTHALGGRTLTKDERIALLYEVLPSAFTEENIKQGFLRTGIFPFNADIIPDIAFLPT
jgi:hypothetical protein